MYVVRLVRGVGGQQQGTYELHHQKRPDAPAGGVMLVHACHSKTLI